ncbi:hypothetical protein PR048_017654 [Dryococelus australis]|uniref:Uncharacterized protein n=1 Tax=Dryococelus australis TaxID=614101 RepID=A0ABQ9HAD4_9NEOP|nr:hypothetical protein PR048_017654 [Dryococelus australis]
MEWHRNARAGQTEDPRENPPTSGIVRHDSHVRKSGGDPTRNQTRLASTGFYSMICYPAGPLADFLTWESCRTMPVVGGFSRGSPVSPTHAFRPCFIITWLHLHDPNVKEPFNCLHSTPIYDGLLAKNSSLLRAHHVTGRPLIGAHPPVLSHPLSKRRPARQTGRSALASTRQLDAVTTDRSIAAPAIP